MSGTAPNETSPLRSLGFYLKLGFRLVSRDDDGRSATLQNGDCRIAVYQGILNPAETQLIFWQGDVDEIGRDLVGKGLRFESGPTKADNGGTGALLRDPDDHPIYFVNMPGGVREEGA